jgi:hypothetical protein
MKKTKTATWPSNITRQNVGCYHAASGGLNLGEGEEGNSWLCGDGHSCPSSRAQLDLRWHTFEVLKNRWDD